MTILIVLRRIVKPDIAPLTVLAVDDQLENLVLLDAILSDAGYQVVMAQNGAEAFEILEYHQPDLILLDVMMPGMDGFEVCRRLKASRRTYFTPVVILTSLSDVKSKIRGLESGADDFLNKPINSVELLARLHALGRIRRLRDELDTTENIIFSMIAALEGKAPLTRDHSLRVATLSAGAGRLLELSASEQATLVWGALLHDLGKLGVPEDVLLKSPDTRTAEEEALYRQHTEHGERILSPLKSLTSALPIVRHHHERLDGSGYPDGLSGDAFHPLIEIVATADAYENYRRAQPASPDSWAKRLRGDAKAGRFRAGLVEKVLRAAQTAPDDLPEFAELLPVVPPPPSGRIFVADDSKTNRELIEALLTDGGYSVETFAHGPALLEAVETTDPDLVLVDMRMPRMPGEEVCRHLKANLRFAFLPVVLMTAFDDGATTKRKALENGADEFLSVPLNRHELLARVRSLLRLHAFHEDLEEHESVVLSLSGALEAKDPYTNGHSARVGQFSMELAREMGQDRSIVRTMTTAGLLHDIGKVAIPQNLLHKQGPLTPKEFEIVKTHPMVGYEICKGLRSARRVLPCIRNHHERFDGSGYPDGLRGEEIPLQTRILSLADAFDALRSDRPYRQALSDEETFEILAEETTEGKHDPEVFKALRKAWEKGLLE